MNPLSSKEQLLMTLLSPLSHFKEQFTYVPEIMNRGTYTKMKHFIVCGMGGSAISVTLLKTLFPAISIALHNSYGLPVIYEKDSTLFILNSYSGNTEEILEAYTRVKKEGAHYALLSRGGELIRLGQEASDTYIQLPESTLEPRFSIGYQLLALLTLLGEEDKISILQGATSLLDMEKMDKAGGLLAETFADRYPVIYASSYLYPIAYLVKAAINEGAKVPCFVNQIPEANHNELQSFVTDETMSEATHFGFLFFVSPYDHVRIQKRFAVMDELYKTKGFITGTIICDHTAVLSIFEAMLTGYYMATYMAIKKGIDPYSTPLIQEFKKNMTQ